MMLKIEPATFPTPKWMRMKSLPKCGNISLELPGLPAADPCPGKGGNRYPVWSSRIHAPAGPQSPMGQSPFRSAY